MLWDATTGRESARFQVISLWISRVATGFRGAPGFFVGIRSPSARTAVGSLPGVDDKTIRLWDVATGRMIRDLTGLRRSVMYAAFSP